MKELVDDFKNKVGIERLGVWFVYVCAQFIVLASLILTTTSVVAHGIFLILSIVFYFITALREPGIYQGKREPNQQDAELSNAKSDYRKQDRHQLFKSQREVRQNPAENKSRLSQAEEEADKESRKEMEKTRPKRTSIKAASLRKLPLPQEETGQKNQLPIQCKKSSVERNKSKIFQAAKSFFDNLTNLVHKKEEEDSKSVKQKMPNLEDKIEQVSQKSSAKKPERQMEEDQKKIKTQTEAANVSSVIREHQQNSAIDREEFQREREAGLDGAKKEEKIEIQVWPAYSHNSVQKKISNIKRYCRICEAYQPLRVKHCHSCDKCIATFDHHCPWMANCIGEKNKFFYLLFLFFQSIQTLTIAIDLIRHLSASEADNKGGVGVLLMVVVLLLIALTALFVFHFYLVAINLTTWQFMRWEKVQYLAIFESKLLQSPFSKGFRQNIKILWRNTKQQEHKKWIQEISQDLSQYRIRRTKACRSMAYNIESDRRPFRSQKAIC